LGLFGLLGLPASVVGTQRGTVTPGGGRSPDITLTQLLSGMFFTREVVDGLSSSLPPSLPPPHAARPVLNMISAAEAATPTRIFFVRTVDDMILLSELSSNRI